MPLPDSIFGDAAGRHPHYFTPAPVTPPLSEPDTKRLAGHMHRMFGLRANDCVGYTPSETQLDPNFQYPAWLTRMMY